MILACLVPQAGEVAPQGGPVCCRAGIEGRRVHIVPPTLIPVRCCPAEHSGNLAVLDGDQMGALTGQELARGDGANGASFVRSFVSRSSSHSFHA